MEKIFVFKADEEKALKMGRVCIEVRTMTDDRQRATEFYSVDPALALIDLVQCAYIDQERRRRAVDDWFELYDGSYCDLEETCKQIVVYADGHRLESTHGSYSKAGIVHKSVVGLAKRRQRAGPFR